MPFHLILLVLSLVLLILAGLIEWPRAAPCSWLGPSVGMVRLGLFRPRRSSSVTWRLTTNHDPVPPKRATSWYPLAYGAAAILFLVNVAIGAIQAAYATGHGADLGITPQAQAWIAVASTVIAAALGILPQLTRTPGTRETNYLLVRSSGAVIVDIVTGQRGMAILPRDDWNGPLWDTLEPIYVPVGQSVTLQATTRVSGMILVGGKIAAISEV
jgi:hypothetical protein